MHPYKSRTGEWVFYTSFDDIDDSWWLTVGGTSWATATFAGIVNSAKHFYTSSVAELTKIYKGIGNNQNFRNISAGYCGEYVGWGVQRLTLNGIFVTLLGVAWVSLVNK